MAIIYSNMVSYQRRSQEKWPLGSVLLRVLGADNTMHNIKLIKIKMYILTK
jgi:hypothetical protein